MITAECHSDDRLVEVTFDATEWFELAKDKDITELAECSFGGDYASDGVAQHFADQNQDIADMFKHIEIMSKRESMGFECYVKYDEAMTWIKENRPHLVEAWKGYEHEGGPLAQFANS